MFDIVNIETGINIINMDSMWERVFMPALHGFLDTIREGKPETLIIAISLSSTPAAKRVPGR